MNSPPQFRADICDYALPADGARIPLLVDLPHGGRIYPPDFGYACPFPTLELCEERHLDTLWTAPVLAAGGVVVKANFPRTYVDVNRAANDIDQLLLDSPWLEPAPDKGRSAQGHGVIMRMIRAGEPIYNRFLSHQDIHDRIDKYYTPYHDLLNYFSNDLHARFGEVYHLDCHSMPAHVVATSFPRLQPDFILGDLDGRSCEHDVRQHVADTLKDMGYRVAINQLYKGAEIINRYGQPAWNRHSLQIEINRGLFQHEKSLEKNKNFDVLARDISTLVSSISARIKHYSKHRP